MFKSRLQMIKTIMMTGSYFNILVKILKITYMMCGRSSLYITKLRETFFGQI